MASPEMPSWSSEEDHPLRGREGRRRRSRGIADDLPLAQAGWSFERCTQEALDALDHSEVARDRMTDPPRSSREESPLGETIPLSTSQVEPSRARAAAMWLDPAVAHANHLGSARSISQRPRTEGDRALDLTFTSRFYGRTERTDFWAGPCFAGFAGTPGEKSAKDA